MRLHTYINKTLGFSEYEIAQMNYFISSILSEISKLLLIGAFFYIFERLYFFLVAAIILCLLRICSGGIHFSHYLPCLLMSFAVFFVGIYLGTTVTLGKFAQLFPLGFCLIINHYCTPVVSSFRPKPNKKQIQRSKLQFLSIITIYSILLIILPKNKYIDVCFWMIILQSIQLFAAKLMKRRTQNHEIEIPYANNND